jgi:hypothetical protein
VREDDSTRDEGLLSLDSDPCIYRPRSRTRRFETRDRPKVEVRMFLDGRLSLRQES